MPTVSIDCFPEAAARHRDEVLVAVDVIRATTTAVTAAAAGWRCYPVPSLEAAVPLAARLPNPLLAGELGGNMPYGFDMTNSPAELALRTDFQRPMILISTAGTQLMCEGAKHPACYAACLRNFSAQAEYLVGRHPEVAVIGAGTRGQFREEDQLCCAWIAEALVRAGYRPKDEETAAIIARWSGAPVTAFTESQSVEYLRRTDQLRDLEFIFDHVDDLRAVFALSDGALRLLPVMPTTPRRLTPATHGEAEALL